MREAISMMVETLGHTVTAYPCGDAAIAALSMDAPPLDLVLSDFNMPGLNGVQTIHQLRRIYPNLKAVICSGVSEATCFADGKIEGCAFLGKPFGLRTLDGTITRLISR